MKAFSLRVPVEFWLLIFIALCAVALDFQRAFGAADELPLFADPPASVISGDIRPELPLFETAAPAPACLNLFESPAPVSGSCGPLDLFCCASQPSECDETSLQSIPFCVRKKGIAEQDEDEIAYCYCPWWCGICREQKKRVPHGIRYVEGATAEGSKVPLPGVEGVLDSESRPVLPLLPKDVREYAAEKFPAGTIVNGKDVGGREHGYPAWKIKTTEGRWIFAFHVRSSADIAAIRKLKPGERIPDSTFWSKDNRDQISSTNVH